jgi:hypothetical protein
MMHGQQNIKFILKFYVLLTVRLDSLRNENQLDALTYSLHAASPS